jgi:hypothetical protein
MATKQPPKTNSAFLDEENPIPTPDPDWDYFDEWIALMKIRGIINRRLTQMAELETRDENFDKSLKDAITKCQRELGQLFFFDLNPPAPPTP